MRMFFDETTVDPKLWGELDNMDEGQRINVPMTVGDLRKIRDLHVAVGHYTSKHGTDTLIQFTTIRSVGDLPVLITDILEKEFGFEVSPKDSFEWIACYPYSSIGLM